MSPDPSYLPAIEDHIRSLKADRETAVAMGADDFVVRNLADQITAFGGVMERMNARMDHLPDDLRAEIEEASRVLRKVRAGGEHVLLPLTVVNRTGTTKVPHVGYRPRCCGRPAAARARTNVSESPPRSRRCCRLANR